MQAISIYWCIIMLKKKIIPMRIESRIVGFFVLLLIGFVAVLFVVPFLYFLLLRPCKKEAEPLEGK